MTLLRFTHDPEIPSLLKSASSASKSEALWDRLKRKPRVLFRYCTSCKELNFWPIVRQNGTKPCKNLRDHWKHRVRKLRKPLKTQTLGRNPGCSTLPDIFAYYACLQTFFCWNTIYTVVKLYCILVYKYCLIDHAVQGVCSHIIPMMNHNIYIPLANPKVHKWFTEKIKLSQGSFPTYRSCVQPKVFQFWKNNPTRFYWMSQLVLRKANIMEQMQRKDALESAGDPFLDPLWIRKPVDKWNPWILTNRDQLVPVVSRTFLRPTHPLQASEHPQKHQKGT